MSEPADPITELVRLRALMLEVANRIEAFGGRNVRRDASRVARRVRRVVMSPECVEACKRAVDIEVTGLPADQAKELAYVWLDWTDDRDGKDWELRLITRSSECCATVANVAKHFHVSEDQAWNMLCTAERRGLVSRKDGVWVRSL